MRNSRSILVLAVGAVLSFVLINELPMFSNESQAGLTAKQRLGKLLFFDNNLSTPPGQSCADCHAPEAGFADPDSALPVSRGVLPGRFGNRNDMPAAYAGFSPEFYYDEEEELYVGGQFWDGRAATLKEQAKGPFLNPLEMANPNEKAVVEKIRRAGYSDLFREVFGGASLDDVTKAYDFAAEALADYEMSSEVNRFSSKYDLYVTGKVKLTEQEQRGLALFEEEDKGNCAACHLSKPGPYADYALFTDYTYDNLGVPRNPANPFLYLPKSLNPEGAKFTDWGLGAVINKQSEMGKFKVPSLRNIAITPPYMHNGVFNTLQEVMSFYNTRDVGPWPAPEVATNVNRDELGDLKLTQEEMDDIVAFLHTLTDGYTPDRAIGLFQGQSP
jgi:cytochrome c peroxidase